MVYHPLLAEDVHDSLRRNVDEVVLGVPEAGVEIELFRCCDLAEKTAAAVPVAPLRHFGR
jgi:hypothetical protein